MQGRADRPKKFGRGRLGNRGGGKKRKKPKKGKIGEQPHTPEAPAGRFLGVTRPLEGQYRPALGSVLVLDNLVHGSVRNITVRLMLDSSLAIVE